MAVTLWLTKDNWFYLFHFSYIGTAVAASLFLFRLNYKHAWRVGNGPYYAAGIALAFGLKNNRAFSKYVCPVTVFLKPMPCFFLLRVK